MQISKFQLQHTGTYIQISIRGEAVSKRAQADIMLHIQIHSFTCISKVQILACSAFIGKVELCAEWHIMVFSCFFMLVQKYDWSKVSLEHEDV